MKSSMSTRTIPLSNNLTQSSSALAVKVHPWPKDNQKPIYFPKSRLKIKKYLQDVIAKQLRLQTDRQQLHRQKSNSYDGVKGYYKQRGMETNFATGFVDLNPRYAEMRHQRAVNLAKKWQDYIGSKLLD